MIKMRKKPFTMVELLVAMGIFTLMMMGMIYIFNSTQLLSRGLTRRADTYETARVFQDLITRDLKTIYYTEEPGKHFFAAYDYAGDNFNTISCISFATVLQTPLTSTADTRITKAFYLWVQDTSLFSRPEYSLQVAYTANDNSKWQMLADNPFTAANIPSATTDYNTIIENVISFNIIPLHSDFSDITPLAADISSNIWSKPNFVPPILHIEFTIVPPQSLELWKELNASTGKLPTDPDSAGYETLILPNMQTFSQIIILQ